MIYSPNYSLFTLYMSATRALRIRNGRPACAGFGGITSALLLRARIVLTQSLCPDVLGSVPVVRRCQSRTWLVGYFHFTLLPFTLTQATQLCMERVHVCMCYTEKATKARHRQERQKQRHNQDQQQSNNATPKQPTNNTRNLCTKHPTHHTRQPALHPH